jgi:hypothetical protein
MMGDKKTCIPENAQSQVGGVKNGDLNCGVPEEQFPLNGKCCSKRISLSGTAYERLCPYCSIFTSIPVGESLMVSHIFECEQQLYAKRSKIDKRLISF